MRADLTTVELLDGSLGFLLVLSPPVLVVVSAVAAFPLLAVQQRLQPRNDHRQDGFGAQRLAVLLFPIVVFPVQPVRILPSALGGNLGGGGFGLPEENRSPPVDRARGLGQRGRGDHAHVCVQHRQPAVGVAVEARRKGQQLR